MTGRRFVLAVVLLLAAAAAGYGAWRWRASGERQPVPDPSVPAVGTARVAVPATERAPAGVRIRVQVLNATRVRGLARRATFVLRDRGFDVVEIGTASEQRDTTLVVSLGGDPAWAALVANALGGGQVETRPDSSRYLDVSVFIGASWRPPAEPFYP